MTETHCGQAGCPGQPKCPKAVPVDSEEFKNRLKGINSFMGIYCHVFAEDVLKRNGMELQMDEEIKNENQRLRECLMDMVRQHCSTNHGFSSGFISTNADAIDLLVELGELEYVGTPSGRAVLAVGKKKTG